jgi:Uncharacterized protein, involved in the regulation of septum location
MKVEARIDHIFDDEKSNMRAFASANIGGEYAIHGIKVMNGVNGNFVTMPQQKGSDGKYHDVFHPVTKESREEIMNSVMNAYNGKLEERMSAIAGRMQEAQTVDEAGEDMQEDSSAPEESASEQEEDIPSFNM